jgi:hypothetical protein
MSSKDQLGLRNVDEEEEFSVDRVDIIPFPGTPVRLPRIAEGSTSLNGMIGDVRDLDVKEKEDGSKYFDKDIGSSFRRQEHEACEKVKATNLRVVFDLPNADDD